MKLDSISPHFIFVPKIAMPPTNKHALVAGASGISGWALVNTLLSDYSSSKIGEPC